MTTTQHRVTATLKSGGAWVVECHDCDFKMPALNQTDAKRLVSLHLRMVTEVALDIENDKNKEQSNGNKETK